MDLTHDQIRAWQEKISQIGDMHISFERQFENFNHIIPYKYNWKIIGEIYSPDLYSLLQGINSANDGMLRIVGALMEIPKQKNAAEYFKLLNPGEMLFLQEVAPVHKPDVIMPFAELRKQDVPSWWTDYNRTKHKLPEGMLKGSYANVIHALGALVILLHISNLRRFHKSDPTKILQSTNWTTYASRFAKEYQRLKFSQITTADISRAKREYLPSQEQIYKSTSFYYLNEFHGNR